MARGVRRYESPLRAEQAQVTRRRILDAARRLLLEQGYSAMTIASLAREAGVSVQTVYNAVGGKPEVVKAVYDATLAGDYEPEAMMERPQFSTLLAERDPRRWFELYADFSAGIVQRLAPLVTTLLAQAAAGDPDLAEFAATIEQERARGTGMVVDEFTRRFPLRPGLTVERAADVLWTLTAPEIADRLVRRRGWTLDEYRAWLATTMADAIVGPRRSRAARS